MTSSRMREFKDVGPRAIVLDDSDKARAATAEVLTSAEFEVCECEDTAEFFTKWAPGMFDVVVADWDLAATDKGDQVLQKVRERDWDVPFVLISGRLEEDHERSGVLSNLLESGSARFVERGDGDGGFEKARDAAFELIEKRDLALLRVILRFRTGALENRSVATSSGDVHVGDLLAEIVRDPKSSDDSDGPIASRIAEKLLGEE